MLLLQWVIAPLRLGQRSSALGVRMPPWQGLRRSTSVSWTQRDLWRSSCATWESFARMLAGGLRIGALCCQLTHRRLVRLSIARYCERMSSARVDGPCPGKDEEMIAPAW